MTRTKKYEYLILGVLVILLAPYFYLSFFTQPIAEDFGFATYYIKNDFIDLLKKSYFSMNGRYIANIFMFISPLSFRNFSLYKWIPIFQIILLCISFFVLVKSVLKITTLKTLIVSLLLTLLLLNNLPIISEGLYWYTGSVIYMLGLSVSAFYFALLFPLLKNKHIPVGRQLLMSLLLFLVCGFNETLTLLIVFFLSVLTFYFHIKPKENNPVLLLQLILGISFSSIMFIAPGNIARDAMYVDNHKVIHSLVYAALQIIRFSSVWIFSIPFILSSCIFISYFDKINHLLYQYKKNIVCSKWSSITLIACMMFICVFPAYWITGILGQHRTLNVAYFFFIPLWFLALHQFYSKASLFQKIAIKIKQHRKIFWFLLLISLALSNNGLNALSDIFTGKARMFSQELNLRHQKLFEAEKTKPKEIVFKPITQPKTIFVTDISEHPNFWTNRGYNDYFNLKETDIYISD